MCKHKNKCFNFIPMIDSKNFCGFICSRNSMIHKDILDRLETRDKRNEEKRRTNSDNVEDIIYEENPMKEKYIYKPTSVKEMFIKKEDQTISKKRVFLESKNINYLKDILTDNGLPISGNKEHLITRAMTLNLKTLKEGAEITEYEE